MAIATSCNKDQSDTRDCFSFTLLLSGIDELTSEIENKLFEAGCDDAILGIHAGTPYLAFDREADSLEEAIRSALHDVEAANVGLEVIRVVPPGEETIEMINTYLKARRILLAKMSKAMADKLMPRVDEVLIGIIEKDPALLKHAFANEDVD